MPVAVARSWCQFLENVYWKSLVSGAIWPYVSEEFSLEKHGFRSNLAIRDETENADLEWFWDADNADLEWV